MVLQNPRLSVLLCVCDCTVESLRLSLQPDLNLSGQAVIRGRNILHRYVHGEMRAALLDNCKSAFGVEGASQGFVSRCDFETSQIKPIDPLIACVARGFLLSLFCFFQGLMKVYDCEGAVWRIEVLRVLRIFYCPGPSRPIVHSPL